LKRETEGSTADESWGGLEPPIAPLVASVAGCALGCLGGGVEEEGVKPSMEGESGGGRVGPNV
jgi:hypothetical protein